jgi:predicted transcriptional regulator
MFDFLKWLFLRIFGGAEEDVNNKNIPYANFRRRTRTGKVKAIGGEGDQGKFKVDKRIYEISDISESAKKVYIYLSRIADSRGYCFPFYKTIAKRCNISTSTVNKALKELESRGLVIKIVRRFSRRGGSSNIYQVQKIGENLNQG